MDDILRIFRRIFFAPFLRQISLRVLRALANGSEKAFYVTSDRILLTDHLLSLLVRVVFAVALFRIFIWRYPPNGYDAVLAAACLCSLLLLEWEKGTRTAYFLKPTGVKSSNAGSGKLLRGKILLGHAAVHAGMSGRTDMMVGSWKGEAVHIPIPLATSRRKKIDLDGWLWEAVLASTGQPRVM